KAVNTVSKMNERMRDSAFATNIDQSWTGAVGGYYGGPRAFNVWSPGGWKRFPSNRELPIWVAGLDRPREAKTAIGALHALGVPRHVYTAVDMESRVDKTYVTHFGETLQAAGYKVFVYGSVSSVFSNPDLNGYWVADYAGIGPFMYDHRHVRATQYATGPNYGSSTVRDWTYDFGTWWVGAALAALDRGQEGRPGGVGHDERGAARVLGVAHRHDRGQVLGDLDALAAVAAAPAALAPAGAGQVVLRAHPAPPVLDGPAKPAATCAMRSTDWPVPRASARRWSKTTL